mgnify:CR=1 FL=1
MKKHLTFLFLILIVACSKEIKSNKQIDGTWKPVSLKISEATGIGVFVDVAGTISFTPTEKKSKSGDYLINIQYTENSTEKSIIESGRYEIEEDMLLLTASDGVTKSSILLYINKTDLEYELPNINNRNYKFVLERDKS